MALSKGPDSPRVEAIPEQPATKKLSRRQLLRFASLCLSAGAFLKVPDYLKRNGWSGIVHADDFDPVREALSGLVAFVVPGPDEYSVRQGVSTEEPGGIDAGIVDALMETLDLIQPAPPPFPNLSFLVATVLNQVAGGVDPDAGGFANLTFEQKVGVFAFIESQPNLAPLASILIPVGLLVYSEFGVYDPATRSLTGWPVGWTLSGYEGVADGRHEFRGYYQNRRKVDQGRGRVATAVMEEGEGNVA